MMVTAEVLFERLATLPPREGFEPATLLTVRDPHAYERLSFVITDPHHAERLVDVRDGDPIVVRLHVRKRQGGGFTARVIEVAPVKKGAA
jgi:hypothetical protein